MMHFKPLRFDLNKKQGQFYLIAAIVIISILVGFVSIRNFTSQNQIEEEKVFFLKDELGFESAQVIDYGIIKGGDSTQKISNLDSFAEDYSEYAGDERNLYFVYSVLDPVTNEPKVVVAGWEDVVSGGISINVGGSGESEIELKRRQFRSEDVSVAGLGSVQEVTVKVGPEGEEIDYTFKLQDGENFFFVVRQQVGDDTVAVNSEEDIVEERK